MFPRAAMAVRSLISAVRTHLSNLFMSETSGVPALFLTPATEETYSVDACYLFVKNSEIDRTKADGSTIRMVEYFKERNGSTHEFLLLSVDLGELGSTYIQVERAGAAGKANPCSDSPVDSQISISSSMVSENRASARDVLVFPAFRNRSFDKRKKELRRTHDCLGSMELNLTISVTQLIILLKVILSNYSYYVLLKHQCFWHARIIWEVLKEEFAGQGGEIGEKAGKFGSVRVSERDESQVNLIRREYRSGWMAFCASCEPKGDRIVSSDKKSFLALTDQNR